MKYLLLLTAFIITPAFSALPSAPNRSQAIYAHLIHDVQTAQTACHQLTDALPSKNTADQKTLFAALVQSWKTVESEYILGEYQSDMIDTPRYLDVFHYNSNQPIQPQLDTSLKNKIPADDALFKNAFNSVNALEYVIYAHPNTALQQRYALNITQSICEHLQDIHTAYQAQKQEILSDSDKLNGILLNTLIDGSYKLKEWRIGDVIGASKKYKNAFEANRAEYPYSQLSMMGIHQILLNHQAMMGKHGILTAQLKNEKNQAILNAIQEHLTQAIALSSALKKDGFVRQHQSQLNQLYRHTDGLQKAYYEKLLGTLNITSLILEADGD